MKRLRTDLAKDSAPDMSNDPNWNDPRFNLIWRPDGFDTEEQNWANGNPVDKTQLITRSSTVDGKWLGGSEHECLPDFSCCRPELAWEVDVRKSFLIATESERAEYLMQSLGALAETELETIYVAGESGSTKH